MLLGIQEKIGWRRCKIAVAIVLPLVGLLCVVIVMTACSRPPEAVLTAASRAPNPYGPLSLDERIFFADAIAIVRPISTEPGVLTLQDTGGQTFYSPVVQSRFEVIEYLKGEGDFEIIVDEKDLRIAVSSEEQAFRTAESDAAEQVSTLESGEAIVFLQRMQYPGQVLDTSRKASGAEWRQHNSPTGLFSAAVDVVGTSGTFSIASAVGAGAGAGSVRGETFSINNLRESIEAMESLLREGEGIEGWKECIRKKLLYGNYRRTYRATHGEDPPDTAELGPFLSGQAAGFTTHSANRVGVGYDKEWLTGEDSKLFEILLLEGGLAITPDYWETRDQVTGYEIEIRAMRPLPVGLYEIYRHGQSPEEIPCEFVQPYSTWIFTFESAAGTLHEAFFDPVDIGDAMGADGKSGVLQPEWFESEEGETVIERIAWREGQVEMELSPATGLDDNRLDFIALDGSVTLRLAFDYAVALSDDDDVATFAWGVCEQPWADGDLLMLRIAEGIPDDGIAATNDPECLAGWDAAPMPEPTPTPTP